MGALVQLAVKALVQVLVQTVGRIAITDIAKKLTGRHRAESDSEHQPERDDTEHND